MKKPNFGKHDAEKKYISKSDIYSKGLFKALPGAMVEGFEVLTLPSATKEPAKRPEIKKLAKKLGPINSISILKSLMGYQKKIMNAIETSFSNIEPYFENLESSEFIEKPELWVKLNDYVRDKWDDVIIGFTELPQEMIFKNKFVLFKYALVVIQEMKKEEIDFAPELQAGKEVMRVYATLGEIVNEIAEWLRNKGVRCQSNHPLGGLVNTPSLAGKAGLGWQGRMGLLINREFGPRLRIAPIFLEHKYFEYTDSIKHKWVEDFCETCHRCQIECPTEAIYEKKKVTFENIPIIDKMSTCINREKCFTYFTKTLGCSICIKVCPFSLGPQVYDKLKTIITKIKK